MSITAIIALLTALGGSTVLGTFITSWFSRKKTNTDAATATVDSILRWAVTLTARIDALEKAVTERDLIIADLRKKVAHLEADLETYKVIKPQCPSPSSASPPQS